MAITLVDQPVAPDSGQSPAAIPEARGSRKGQYFRQPVGSKFAWTMIFLGIIAGTVLRFVHLDRRIYWQDEVVTSFFVCDSTDWKLDGQRACNRDEILRSLEVNPNSSLSGTVKKLAHYSPEQGPLYYIVARLWAERFGSTPAQMRMPGDLISLLIIPAVGWLMTLLSGSLLAGGSAAALIALSPLQLHFAQEARPYGLWTLLFVLSSIALLRAMKLSTWRRWAAYAVLATAGMYTQLLSCFLLGVQAAYVVILEKFRPTQRLLMLCCSVAFVIICCLPWFICFLVAKHYANDGGWNYGSWFSTKTSLYEFWRGLPVCVSHAFFAGWYQSRLFTLVRVCSDLLSLYSFYRVARRMQPRYSSYLLGVVLVPVSILFLQDCLYGGSRSSVERYMLPSLLGVELCVAYLITLGLSSHRKNLRLLFNTLLCAVLSLEFVSSLDYTRLPDAYNRTGQLQELALVINKSVNPVVVCNQDYWLLAVLCQFLDRRVKIMPAPDTDLTELATLDHFFLLGPSPALLEKVKESSRYDLRYVDGCWSVENRQ